MYIAGWKPLETPNLVKTKSRTLVLELVFIASGGYVCNMCMYVCMYVWVCYVCLHVCVYTHCTHYNYIYAHIHTLTLK